MKLTVLPFKLSFKRLALLAATTAVCGTALAQSAICYNCPRMGRLGHADQGHQGRYRHHRAARQQELRPVAGPAGGREGQPVADVTYLGVTFAIQAQKDGVVAAYKPAHWDQVPAGLKDPKGEWVTIHSGTLGFMVNKAALGGKPVPQSWADLLKPEYKGLVGYLDPASAFVGYVGAVAVNQAMGGTLDNFQPAIDYFKKLQKNEPIVPKQTSYARLLSGEIGILLDYDFNAYRARYKDKADVDFVIPKEGTVVMPYVMSLVNKAPHTDNGKKVLDYVLSDKGQSIWANAYLRPVRDVALPRWPAISCPPASTHAPPRWTTRRWPMCKGLLHALPA